MAGRSNAELAFTVPTGVNVVPSSEYDQTPRPVVPTKAIPPKIAPGSASVICVDADGALMNVPAAPTATGESSSVLPIDGEAGVNTGAWLVLTKFTRDCSSVGVRNAAAWPPKPEGVTRALAAATAAARVVATMVK